MLCEQDRGAHALAARVHRSTALDWGRGAMAANANSGAAHESNRAGQARARDRGVQHAWPPLLTLLLQTRPRRCVDRLPAAAHAWAREEAAPRLHRDSERAGGGRALERCVVRVWGALSREVWEARRRHRPGTPSPGEQMCRVKRDACLAVVGPMWARACATAKLCWWWWWWWWLLLPRPDAGCDG